MANKQQVIDMHAQFPHWTRRQIADALDCHPSYVHAAVKRYGLDVPYTKRGARPAANRKLRSEDLRALAADLIQRAEDLERRAAAAEVHEEDRRLGLDPDAARMMRHGSPASNVQKVHKRDMGDGRALVSADPIPEPEEYECASCGNPAPPCDGVSCAHPQPEAQPAAAAPSVVRNPFTGCEAEATFGRVTIRHFGGDEFEVMRRGAPGRGPSRSYRIWLFDQLESALHAAAMAKRRGFDTDDELAALRWAAKIVASAAIRDAAHG